MQVQVGSYYHDEARGAQREIHLTLNDADGEELFPKGWSEWEPEEKFRKLSGIADILTIKYAVTRGFRSVDTAATDRKKIIERDLK